MNPWLVMLCVTIPLFSILFLLVYFIFIPYAQLQARRRLSRMHIPQVQEIWVQDDTILWIAAVTPVGVEIISPDPVTKKATRWRDSWEDWYRRLDVNTVFYTGERRPIESLQQ